MIYFGSGMSFSALALQEIMSCKVKNIYRIVIQAALGHLQTVRRSPSRTAAADRLRSDASFPLRECRGRRGPPTS